jgi:hypothetical protein
MHRFRIIQYRREDASYYETRVKTWIGWVSFSVFYKTDIIHIFSDPTTDKSLAYEKIYQYCQVRGYRKKEIEITEINKDDNKRWISFLRG